MSIDVYYMGAQAREFLNIRRPQTRGPYTKDPATLPTFGPSLSGATCDKAERPISPTQSKQFDTADTWSGNDTSGFDCAIWLDWS